MTADLFTDRACHFSPCRKYRYALKITWDATRKPQMFIGLNPSTADEENDDPTVRRCIDYAQRWGAGGLVMCNVAAYRSTDPNAMLQVFRMGGDVFGPENTLGYLEKIATQCQGKPLAAWGKHATKIRWQYNSDLSECAWNRHQELKKFIGPLDCLKINGDGTPIHPLYQPATLKPIPFNYARSDAA